MTYDEFSDKLRKIKIEYESKHNKQLNTISELEIFLDSLLKRKTRNSLKSLKGLTF